MKYRRDPVTGGRIKQSVYDSRYSTKKDSSNIDNSEVLGEAIEKIIDKTKKVKISGGEFLTGVKPKNKYIKVNF
jgi:hypothetical protein